MQVSARRLVWVALLCLLPAAAQAQAPVITAVTSAGFLSAPTPDGLGTIFGSGLSDGVYMAIALPLPSQLGPTSLSICPGGPGSSLPCVDALLLYVSPTQVNFYVPSLRAAAGGPFAYGTNYPTTFSLKAGGGSVQFAGALSTEAPSIFASGWDCDFDPNAQDTSTCGLTPAQAGPKQVQRAALIDLTGHVITSLNPARIGPYYSIYLTGLYEASGQAYDPKALASVDFSAIAGSASALGSFSVTPSYAGPSTYVGVQQVNFTLNPNQFGDAAAPLFACKDFRFDIPITFSLQGIASDVHAFSLPLLIKNGDIPCGP